MKCSVVIPTRNDSAYLHRCLSALRQQTRTPDQIIVVDNGSTDNITRVLREFPDLTYLREEAPGVAYAVRSGYDAARHPLILRCDADSIPPEYWVERMVTALQHLSTRTAGPDVVAVTGMARFGPNLSAAGRVLGFLYSHAYRLVAGLALGHAALWGSNMAMTAQWWNSVRDRVHLSPEIHDDFDLSFQLRPTERIHVDCRGVMTVSWRAASSWNRIVRQLRMATITMNANWAEEKPWERMVSRWRPSRG